MKILFLDIDGVLNNNRIHFEWINRDCMARLNRIVRITGCHIVIHSAWRHMIINGAMTLQGFGHMLTTHGFAHADKIVGHTDSNDTMGRSVEIMDYLEKNPCEKYLAVDDLALVMGNSYQTDGDVGLTDEDAEEIIKMLGEA